MSDSISRFSSSSNSAFSLRKQRTVLVAPTAGSGGSVESPIADVTGVGSSAVALKGIGTPSPSSRESTDFNSSSHTITRVDNSSSATEFLTSTPSSLSAIHPTLLARLERGATSEELRDVLESTPRVHVREIKSRSLKTADSPSASKQGSRLRSQAKERLHRLLLDPRRIPVRLLRQLGY